MPDEDETRMPLTSADVVDERVDRLRELFPEAFTEGRIDFGRLRAALGGVVDTERERYGLSWAGKADAIRAVQTPSTGTLAPCPEESVNFDTTQNVFLEGENLEVLKLLQRSYHGKVKMIYIDPPYNTGNDFIYPDNYRDSLGDYLRFSGQVDGEGAKLSTNTEAGGRFHSSWLSMMYPRLFLARNLLREDGVIFVSIDDNEVHNLRLLMNEVFGEENFVAEIAWKNIYGGGSKSKHVVPQHEYVVCYARSKDAIGIIELPPDPEAHKRYTERDDKHKTRGPYFTQPLATTSMDTRPNLRFPIRFGSEEIWPEKQWQWSQERVKRALENDELVFNKQGDKWSVRYKQYLRDEDGRERGAKLYSVQVKPWSQEGTAEIVELLGDGKIFPFPKPSSLIKHLLGCTWQDDDAIVLDFFAGSCSTAQAVLALNREYGTSHRFIMAQLPEPTEDGSPAKAAGLATIADIGKERIRRVLQKLEAENDGKLDLADRDEPEDLGFKVFKLTSSNFRIWNAETAPREPDALAEQLRLYAENVLPGRSQQDILYELILKAGLPLTVPVKERQVAKRRVYDVAEGTLLVCLEEEVDLNLLRAMMKRKPQQILCLDNAFGDNDQLKTNTVLEMRSHGIEFRTV